MTTLEPFGIAPDLLADMEAAIDRAEKGLRDPRREKAARDSMDRIREEIRREHGILNIGLPAIRQLRDA